MNLANETYFSVDIETAGPNPGQYSLLAIGACTLGPRPSTFYIEVQPVNKQITPEAYAVHHLDMKRLSERGLPPASAMASFEEWVLAETPEGSRPVFLAFNAPFDWMFIADYFHRYLNRNPFGFSALDIKAFYMKMNEDGNTVRAMDVLFPKIGEIIGGSQREEDFAKLEYRINELGIPMKDLWWYLDTRRFGSAPHSARPATLWRSTAKRD